MWCFSRHLCSVCVAVFVCRYCLKRGSTTLPSLNEHSRERKGGREGGRRGEGGREGGREGGGLKPFWLEPFCSFCVVCLFPGRDSGDLPSWFVRNFFQSVGADDRSKGDEGDGLQTQGRSMPRGFICRRLA